MKHRRVVYRRKTAETDIEVEMDLDGCGVFSIATGLSFLDHMLELLARHSAIDLVVRARGDLDVDHHHTVEDVGLTLGTALDRALGDRRAITRYGWASIPMDDALTQGALDLGGRPYLVYSVANRKKKILDFDLGLVEEFFRAFVVQARMNLHVAQLYGTEPHHAYESMFKAVARALRMAVARDPRNGGVPSTKGRI
ncbi:MAG: imidazoleglycerol-phosphate dehydratase HisB [Kiritimatiellae bacterium]|nr:imidazoleglycerol-phosphate dehydratase HisB [Kiritimatiellia bacterium]